MTSSLRQRDLKETRALARRLAPTLGITEVTDSTGLDVIGIPVYTSIRTSAVPGALCVHAGKGVRPREAEVGAYMEAIEFAAAEYDQQRSPLILSTPAQIGRQDPSWRFVDLCPLLGRTIDPDGALAAVVAEDIVTGRELLVPAELVYSPFRDAPGQLVFGSSTNGLSSGNTRTEATVHAIAEVLERDIQSFQYVHDDSQLVHLQAVPPALGQLTSKVRRCGMTSVLRYTANPYGLPYFQGFILEADEHGAIPLSSGFGLHLLRDIAAVRALSEAAQGRVCALHGGRDDIVKRSVSFGSVSGSAESAARAAHRRRVLRSEGAIDYDVVVEAGTVDSVDAALERLLEVLDRAGHRQVLRVVLSPDSWPFAVVKIIVPGLESFSPDLPRVGPRLAAHGRQHS